MTTVILFCLYEEKGGKCNCKQQKDANVNYDLLESLYLILWSFDVDKANDLTKEVVNANKALEWSTSWR